MKLLLAIALLGIGISACGSAGKSATSVSGSSSSTATTGSARTTATSTGAKSDTTVEGPGSGNTNSSETSTHGHVASSADTDAITTLVKRYYAVAAADDGAAACKMIYSIFAEAIAEDYGQPPGPPDLRGKTCAVVMSKLFKHVPNQPPAVLSKTEVTSVRVKGRFGFALLRSKAVPSSEIMVERERHIWKINALIGSPCINCAVH